MMYTTILDEKKMPTYIPNDSRIVINQKTIDHMNELESQWMLSTHTEKLWNEIKKCLPLAHKKRKKNGELLHILPSQSERKNRMETNYISFYGDCS